jgi:hypothetical protein
MTKNYHGSNEITTSGHTEWSFVSARDFLVSDDKFPMPTVVYVVFVTMSVVS